MRHRNGGAIAANDKIDIRCRYFTPQPRLNSAILIGLIFAEIL